MRGSGSTPGRTWVAPVNDGSQLADHLLPGRPAVYHKAPERTWRRSPHRRSRGTSLGTTLARIGHFRTQVDQIKAVRAYEQPSSKALVSRGLVGIPGVGLGGGVDVVERLPGTVDTPFDGFVGVYRRVDLREEAPYASHCLNSLQFGRRRRLRSTSTSRSTRRRLTATRWRRRARRR
jgi:hypothetical protein